MPGVFALSPAESAGPVLPTQEEFKPLVTDARGFEYRPERPGAPNFVQQKWGWTGLQPGVQHGLLVGQLWQPPMASLVVLLLQHRCPLSAGDWAELEVDTEQLRPRSPHNAIVCEWRHCCFGRALVAHCLMFHAAHRQGRYMHSRAAWHSCGMHGLQLQPDVALIGPPAPNVTQSAQGSCT